MRRSSPLSLPIALPPLLLIPPLARLIGGAVIDKPGIYIPDRRTSFASGLRKVFASVGVKDTPTAYVIDINIGGQVLPVVLDTGSADLWVASSECDTSSCQSISKFNKSASSTLAQTSDAFKLSYIIGSVSGTVATDTVTIGQYQISSQTIALANSTTGLDLVGMGSSGILGLSFAPAAAIPSRNGHTLLDNLFSYLPEASRFFAFKLGRQSLSTPDAPSSFTIGEVDKSIVNDTSTLSFSPVYPITAQDSSYDFWKLPILDLTINSTRAFKLSPSSVRGSATPIAVLDTGTTLVLGPSKDVEAFWEAVGSSRKNPQSGMWEVKCERAALVTFTLGTKGNETAVPVHPLDLNFEVGASPDGYCEGGIQANDGVNSGDWLLGDVFLRNAYVVHQVGTSSRPPQIGLLNLTFPDTALSEFRAQRGPDNGPPPPLLRPVSGSISQERGQSFYYVPIVSSVSAVVGLALGALLTIIYRTRQRRQAKL